jgi:ABC-2 type transport system permease protein
MGERLVRMMVKEFLQVLRDPRMLGIIIGIPLIQTLVFGYVVSTDVNDVPTAVVDFDRSASSRELLSAFSASGHFRFVLQTREPSRAESALDDGSAGAILRIDEGFAGDLAAGRTARLQLIVDGSDSNTARVVLVYAGRIAGRFSEMVRVARVSRIAGRAVPAGGVELVPRAWFNENLESRNFFVPGIIAMLVMLVTVMLTSMAVVREKEVGTIEQLLVSPITPAEFILGKTLPFAIVGYVDVLLVTLVGVLWFGVPIRGSVLLLAVATTFYLMTTLGIGLLISTVCRTQQQAMMTVFFVFFPCILLSGFMFPIENMPPVVQYLTYLDPLRYFLVILRGIFLKGAGAGVLWPQMAALLVMGAATLAAATLRFRKTVA